MKLSELLAATPQAAPTLVPLELVPLEKPLFDHQTEAAKHCIRPNGGGSLLAMEMGTGKTAVSIAVIAAAQAKGVKSLVVVPPNLRFNWRKELRDFAPWIDVATIWKSKPSDEQPEIPNTDVVIIGNMSLKHWEPKLKGFGVIVADESQSFKDSSSGRTKSFINVCKANNAYKILLSGTPNPNGRNMEFAPQIEAMGKWSAVGGKSHFWSRFAPPATNGYGRESRDERELNQLLIADPMFRVRKRDVLSLEEKAREAVAIESDKDSAKKYIKIQNNLMEYLQDIGREWKSSRGEAIRQLGYLREMAGIGKVNGIVDHVKNIINDVDRGGVFIVAEHHSVMDNLNIGLVRYDPVTVHGAMTPAAKQRAIDHFTSGRSRIMIGQVKAAGVGLTLHGGGLNRRVVVAQLPWTPADLVQAEDRLHRIGQPHEVDIEVMLCSIDNVWTIDERLWNLLEKKYFAIGESLDGEGEYLLEEVQNGLLDTYR